LPIPKPNANQQLRNQLKLILALLLFQLPLTLYQRFTLFEGVNSGDQIVGTLNISSILSICLISGVAVLFAFNLRKRISNIYFITLCAILLIPTTLNETKGSLILLPIAIGVPTLLWIRLGKKITVLVPATLLGLVFVGAFIALYNQSLGQTRDRSITEFVSSGDYSSYLYKGADEHGLTVDTVNIGKVDSYVLAIENLSSDVTRMAFGLGIGNVSQGFSKALQGDYNKYALFAPQTTALSYLLWETGIIGLLLLLMGCSIVLNDACHMARNDTLIGVFALGWAAVVVIYIVSLSYKNIIPVNVIGYLFWYFSGYIAAARYRSRFSYSSSKIKLN